MDAEDNQEKAEGQKEQETTLVKKPYHTPVLREYGTINSLTENNANMGVIDNPSGTMKT